MIYPSSKFVAVTAIFLASTVLVFLLFPAPVDAQLPTQLVPECESAGGVENVCSICHIFQLVDNILKFIFALAAVGAIVMLLWGGFLMIMPWPDPNRYTRARKILVNAFIGVLIIFFSWLLVDTIIKILAQQTVGTGKIPTNVSVYGPWNKIDCDVLTVVSPPGPPGAPGGPPGGPPSPGPVAGTEKLSEQDARNYLAANGISINKSPCPVGVKFTDVVGGCTTLEGVKKSTLDEVIRFKNECPTCGSILLNAGTELGHAVSVRSHATGDKVDINATPALLTYITTSPSFTFVGLRIPGDSAKLYKAKASGAIYAIEATHVDILTPL